MCISVVPGVVDRSLWAFCLSDPQHYIVVCQCCYKNAKMENARKHLVKVVGTIEYELALNNMIAKQYERAIELYKLAASHGNASAIFNLGVCLELGIGVEKNYKFAYQCYKEAASMGHQKALHNKLEYEKRFKNKNSIGRFTQRRE